VRRLFRRRVEPQPPPGATPDEAAAQPITTIRDEEVVTPTRRGPPRIWPWLLALLLLVLAGLAGLYFLTRDDDESSEAATATVPDVVGMRGVEAARRIQAAGLRPQVRHVFSRRRPNQVLSQRPAAGAELRPQGAVLLTLSRGVPRVDVPDLVGHSEADAAEELTREGLETRVVRVASRQRVGTVVAQNPAPGERVRRGTTVRVNVSRGRTATTTTTTTTTTTATTRTTTRATTTTTTTRAATTRPATATTPPRTRALATVPDVVGLDEPAAERDLRQAGFAVRSVSRNTADPAQDGVVLGQRPAGGTRARAGSQVTITVGVLTP
jgi:beta-lactam-binding protein with PASTA domain